MILAITNRYGSSGVYYILREFKDIFEELGVALFPVSTVEEHEKIAAFCSGLIVTGSSINVNPHQFGEEPIVVLDEKADEMDLLDFTYIRAFHRLHKPILAICRGIQALNVCFGGSLYQQIPNHRLEPAGRHSIQIQKDSFLYQCYQQESIQVNSLHGQALKDIGKNFKITSVSPDGITEAIEQDNMIGVQWHPEMMMDLNFFKTFIKYFL